MPGGPAYNYVGNPQLMPPQKRPETEEERAARKKKNRLAVWLGTGCLALAVCVTIAGVILQQVRQEKRRQQAAAAPAFTLEKLPEDLDGGLSTAQISQRVSPSVVCINVYQKGSLSADGSGSGIVMNAEGFIVTNAHVVEDAASLTVQLYDGREVRAERIGEDVKTDLAVVKIEADDLTPAIFGDSDALQVGERCVAIGNAAGQFTASVT